MESAQLILPAGASLAGRYEIRDVIGIGGMAIVYEAEHLPLGRLVALKILNHRLAADEAFRRRFRREAEHAAGLDHPNIVTIHDFGEDDDRPYLAMQLVRGGTLADELADRPMTAARCVEVVTGLAAAIDHAHERGVLHRDIKPQNVLVDSDGGVHLADFGIAKGLGGSGTTATGGLFGTVRYASPEQVRGTAVGAASDLYSLGVVTYECLTGKHPYLAASDARLLAAHLDDQPAPIRGGEGAADVFALVSEPLDKDPARRPQQATEFAWALGEALGAASAPSDAPPFSRVEPSAAVVDIDWWQAAARQETTAALAELDTSPQTEPAVDGRPRTSSGRRRLRRGLAAATIVSLTIPAIAWATWPERTEATEKLTAAWGGLSAEPVPAVAAQLTASLADASETRGRAVLPQHDHDLRAARASNIAEDYGRAAERLTAAVSDRPFDDDLARLKSALSTISSGFGSLASAAEHGSATSDRRARATIKRGDESLAAAARSLAARGYAVGDRRGGESGGTGPRSRATRSLPALREQPRRTPTGSGSVTNPSASPLPPEAEVSSELSAVTPSSRQSASSGGSATKGSSCDLGPC